MSLNLDMTALGPLARGVDSSREHLRRHGVLARIAERDFSVWKPVPDEIASRLGWMDSPTGMAERLGEIDEVVDGVRRDGLTHALLLGMGGSSLAPEVFRRLFGVSPGYLDLSVLDSTDPTAVAAATGRLDPARTLYLPATKSGGTVETLSFYKYCYGLAVDAVGRQRAGSHFVAITDPGSGLADLAAQLDARHIFLNDPHIGGRYSALSCFGLVPARLGGVDAARLLAGALGVANGGDEGPGAVLGAVLGAAVRAGRDKLTLLMSPSLEPFGCWVEQLVAESTGKEGTGILPVDGEPPGDPSVYASDRLFVYTGLAGEDDVGGAVGRLADAGHPLVRLRLGDLHDAGAAMFAWELATIVAGHFMGINPFDQPNVEAAKVLARSMMDAYRQQGSLPALEPSLQEGGVTVYGGASGGTLAAAVRAFLGEATSGSPRAYVAFQAYLPPSAATDACLKRMRLNVRDRLRLATTVGYGPRFLHSTGQLHKGDAGNGLFVQLTCDDGKDVGIPDEPGGRRSAITFGLLKAAQSLGDRQALIDGGRAVLRLHLGRDVAAGLAAAEQAFEASTR